MDRSPVVRDGQVTLLDREGGAELGVPVPEPPRDETLFCEGWNGGTMKERQAPFWIYGAGTLRVDVSAAGETPATMWVDGGRADTTTVSETTTLQGELADERWHAVVLEVPELLDISPPEGLRLEGLDLAPR